MPSSAGALTEAEWQSQVVDLAHALGWTHLHVRRSIGKGRTWQTTTNLRGWPDLFLWSHRHPGLPVAAELKTDAPSSKPTDEQLEVLDGLRAAGIRAEVWRPRDFDHVRAVLTDPAVAAYSSKFWA